MTVIPLNWLGLALILASFALFLLDVKMPGVEALTFAGVGTLVAGALILFNTPPASPYGRVSVLLVAATALVIGAFFAFIVAQGLRAQKRRPSTGAETLVGQRGFVRTPLDPMGTVQVAGELWSAIAEDGPLDEGEAVEVTRIEGVKLRVRRTANGE